MANEEDKVLAVLLSRFDRVEHAVDRLEDRLDVFKDEVRREIRSDFKGFKGTVLAVAAIAAAAVTPLVVWALDRLHS